MGNIGGIQNAVEGKISQENREDVELPDVRNIRLLHAVLPLLPHHRHHQPFLRKILIKL